MSLPWKSELQLRLGRDGCAAEVRAPWSRRVLAQAQAPGRAPASIAAALQALRALGHETLPRQARLLVPDEHAYLSLRPPLGRWQQAHQDALAHFAQVLGRQDLLVQVSAIAGGAAWLAAAIDPADLKAWQAPLAEAGIALAHVQLALLDDLHHIAAQVGERAIVALLREEGMTLVRVADGAPIDLCWERCDPHSLRCIEQRLLAFQNTGSDAKPDPLLMLCRSQAQREAWHQLARAHRWTLLLRDAPPSAQPLGLTA